jgi:RNA polymerase sigma factor (sigma-70 family)
MAKSRILTERPSQWVEKVWRKNASKIYKLCQCQSSDADRAKDLFQEVALRFCKSASTLDLKRPVEPWFRAVVHNAFCDMNRRLLPVVPFSKLSDACVAYNAGENASIMKEIRENRRRKYVRDALDNLMEDLSAVEKMAIEFTCIGEISAAEASLFCGVEKATFFKRKTVALSKMRKKKDFYMASLEKKESSRLNLDDLLTRASEFS